MIWGHFGHFWPRDKSKPIFGNGIPSPIEWVIRFFDRWPFLAIFSLFSGISAIFGLGTKVRPFLEMAYQAGLDGSFGFLIGGHFWPFLAIFGHFSGPFLPIFGFNHKSVFIRVFYAY